MRDSFSDNFRTKEFLDSVYFINNNFSKKLVEINDLALIDLGANIGLSSLSLVSKLSNIIKVVGVEAEHENFKILSKNYNLWSKKNVFTPNRKIEFIPYYAVASNSDDRNLNISAHTLPGGVSASGIFTFELNNKDKNNLSSAKINYSSKTLSVNKILERDLLPNQLFIIKIDIEAGESQLFKSSYRWLEKALCLTIELHDSMGKPNSSKSFLNALNQYDFAIVPREDVLHCYNRSLLKF